MSYRKTSSDPLDEWRKINIVVLIELGIPAEIIADHQRFLRAIDQGEDEQTRWNFGWVKPENTRELFTLLGQHFTPNNSYLMRELAKRLDIA
ncbi:hypothetical protein [Roseobacter sp. CCS2]|uniref:hypothetical protein n=1 Tax=Roseobacter sp. CCS2 TaxID=391593 RepID=UPI0000F3E475|nr:hypothetical protein [Roseobacter sp. CCS2]EBA12100.1 hypothetical protein RCCS2_12424 [Roseobacter sp. CCS2]